MLEAFKPEGPKRPIKSLRSFPAIRQEAIRFCGFFLRKGKVFAYVGINQNLKDLKDPEQGTPSLVSASSSTGVPRS